MVLQGKVVGGGKKWLDPGCVFKVELLEVVDRLDVGCEHERILKSDSRFLDRRTGERGVGQG